MPLCMREDTSGYCCPSLILGSCFAQRPSLDYHSFSIVLELAFPCLPVQVWKASGKYRSLVTCSFGEYDFHCGKLFMLFLIFILARISLNEKKFQRVSASTRRLVSDVIICQPLLDAGTVCRRLISSVPRWNWGSRTCTVSCFPDENISRKITNTRRLTRHIHCFHLA